MRKNILKRLLSLILAVVLTLYPLVPVLAEEVTEQSSDQPAAEQQATVESTNSAAATEIQGDSVENNNQAEVTNDLTITTNTGDNLIISPAPTIAVNTAVESVTPFPVENTPNPTPSIITESLGTEETAPAETEPLGIGGSSPVSSSEVEISPTPTGELSGDGGVPAVNEGTAPESENQAVSSDTQSVFVGSINSAEINNQIEGNSASGDNSSEGDGADTSSGDSNAAANVANIANTNAVGENFVTAMTNIFENKQGDLDLSEVEIPDNIDPELFRALATNFNTGDSSSNSALADILSALFVQNTNMATISNQINLSSSTGGNQITGDDGSIETGSAVSSLNLFNMANTNLTGVNWFFGVINLFAGMQGDILLPYELQFFESLGIGSSASMVGTANLNGQGANTADSSLLNSLRVTNSNDAVVVNDINISANSGNNTIVGDGSIDTGSANTSLNLGNVVNTNITGSDWIMVAINNYGKWNGQLNGWWGNTFTHSNTTLAWFKRPAGSIGGSGDVLSANIGTGVGSENSSTAGVANITEVQNGNKAVVENIINISADTGNNNINGRGASVNTGDATARANVFNLVNTNITGNNWYFGMINIFDDLVGDIVFPRPDLSVVKTGDKSSVGRGEEITYTIRVINTGRLWAKDVVVSDVLPANVDFVSASDGGVYGVGEVTWNLGKIYPEQEEYLTVVVRVDNDAANGAQIINIAETSTSTDEPCKSNNKSEFISTIIVVIPTPSSVPGGGQNGDGGGGGVGGTSTSSSSGGQCNDAVPGGAPQIISAIPGTNSVTLVWEKAANPVSYYLVAYGEKSGEYIYGNPNVGGSDTISYTVTHLSGGKTYYFVVRAGNGCAPGAYSNEVTVTPFGGGLIGWAEDFIPGVKGAYASEGEIGGGEATQAGEVEGAVAGPACNWWWILPVVQAGALGGYFLLGGKKVKKNWLRAALGLAILSWVGEHFIAHIFYTPSRWCAYDGLFAAFGSFVPSALRNLLSKKIS